MQYLKWVFAVLCACLCSVFLIGFLVHTIEPDIPRFHVNDYQYWLINIVLALSFALFVMLAVKFAPRAKRMAALTALVVSIAFIVMGIMQHILDDGFLNTDHVFRYTLFVLAILGAYLFSTKRLLPKVQ
jgi:hypothetical protein